MKNTSILLILLFILLLCRQTCACLQSIDPALGANPSYFNMSEQVSRDIYSQNISPEEKFYLLIHNSFPKAPLLSSIMEYDLLLPFSCPPDGTQVIDKNFIKGAWVRVITIMPSVTDEGGDGWVRPKGKVLVAHNYSIQLPPSATNSYPDCGVVYTLLNSSNELSVYANGVYLGSSTLTDYETDSTELRADAELLVSAMVKKDYYVSECYCCGYGDEGCESTCCSCKFSNKEEVEEHLNLSNSLERRVYRPNISAVLTMLQCPKDPLSTASGNLSLASSAPIQSMTLSFVDSNISVQTHELDIMPVLKPHNVLEARSVSRNHEFSQKAFVSGANVSNGLILLNFTGVPREYLRVSHASLMLVDLFGEEHNLTNYTEVSCPLNPVIELSVPHWAEEGAEFQATVRLSEGGSALPGRKVKVLYSAEEYTETTDSNGEAVFRLKAKQGLIEAQTEYDGSYAEVKASRNIMVYSSATLTYLLTLLALLFILALSYTALRRMMGGGQ